MTEKPIARHDYPPEKFPLTLRIYSGKTDALLWSRTVTLTEARALARIEIPGYAGTEHHPVRVEIVCADGTTGAGYRAVDIVCADGTTGAGYRAVDIECPTCHAWVGWACTGPNYGYHAAGYHPARRRAAARASDMGVATPGTSRAQESRRRA